MRLATLLMSVASMAFRCHAYWTGATEIEQAKWFVVAMIFLAAHFVLVGLEKRGG